MGYKINHTRCLLELKKYFSRHYGLSIDKIIKYEVRIKNIGIVMKINKTNCFSPPLTLNLKLVE